MRRSLRLRAMTEAGKSVDDIVKDLAADYLSKCPPDFVEEIFRAQITKLKGPPGVADKGFGAPLNIFLFQELQRLQNIIAIVRTNLQSLIMAIEGIFCFLLCECELT